MLLLASATAICFIACWYAGVGVDWFVSSPYCMPFLRRLIFAFATAAWARAAWIIATRVFT